MKELILKYVAVILTSSVKYLFGVFAAIGANLNFIETLLCTVGGGMLGVVVYLYLWEGILFVYHKINPPKPKEFKPVGKHRRKLLKFIIKYEIVGIVILTPLLLSVPVGTILAAAFEENKWKIKRYMFFSFLGWTLLTYGLYAMLGVKLTDLF
jgi:hypothetical protein